MEEEMQTALVHLVVINYGTFELKIPAKITVKELRAKIEEKLNIGNIEFFLVDGKNIYIGDRNCADHVLTFPPEDVIDVSGWKFYNPAYLHYGRVDANVSCDNCGTHPSTCWGLPGMRDDLCEDCFKDYREGKNRFVPKRNTQSILSRPFIGGGQPHDVK